MITENFTTPDNDRSKFNKSDYYEKWFSDLVHNYYESAGRSVYDSEDAYLRECAFFMTMTFAAGDVFKEKLRLGLMNHDFSIELDSFHMLYNALASFTFGKGWRREKFAQSLPKVIVCLDFEGSRFASVVPASPKNVHIHAIWLIHPKEIARFKRFVYGPLLRLKFLNSMPADAIEFEPYIVEKARAGRLGTYVSKTWIKSEKLPLNGELFRIYPNRNESGEPYQASHRYAWRNKILDRMRQAIRRTSRGDRALSDRVSWNTVKAR
ncbi:hypothetical protein [Mesorhizobium silamurunense]|uniref:hypothetical protein n=1 Tax=Mesorhizobium silamurunense TaxID=499528 RepID=UPI001782F39D|nr:hypothetical protein [Mesorhizobium silamurunense]